MDGMNNQEKSDLVAQKARDTFYKIRSLRKSAPEYTKKQRDQLTTDIKQLQDQWWEDVKQYMTKD